MTRPQAVTIVSIVALLFASLASWGVYNYLQQQANNVKAGEGQNVVVATGEIPIGTKLDITQMKTITVPKATVQTGTATAPNALVGRIVIRPLSSGDAITEQKMMPKEGASMAGVMSYIVPKGHRAITVAVNEVAGVAGFVAPNNRVDIVLTTPIPDNSKGESISKIILQNVTVLATGQITEQKDGKPSVVPTVTLDLIPEDSEKLILAASKGSLQLLLRNIVDVAPVEAKGATISKVLTGIETPVVRTAKPATRIKRIVTPGVVALPQKRHFMEITQGNERTILEFNK